MEKGSSSLSPRHFLREWDAEGLGGGGLGSWGWTSSPAPGPAGYTRTSVACPLETWSVQSKEGHFNLVTSQSDLALVSGCLALPLATLGSLRGLWPWPPGTLTHPGLWIPREALDPGGRPSQALSFPGHGTGLLSSCGRGRSSPSRFCDPLDSQSRLLSALSSGAP